MQDFSDIHLFMINFAEKNKLLSSKYLNEPRNTKKILQDVTDPDVAMTAAQGLEKIILSKSIPRNDGFVQLYGSRQQPQDLVFILRREKFKSHAFVLQQSSEYMSRAMKKNQETNMQHLGHRLN